MALSWFTDFLSEAQQQQLLEYARRTIQYGTTHHCPLDVDDSLFEPALRECGASFVTLHHQGALRGCIGTLEAHQPLILDVVEHAFQAAFNDPRFPPVTDPEVPNLHIEISVLSPSEPLPCRSEQALLSKLQPGLDGLILQEGTQRATFLPSVWQQLPDAAAFVRQLKLKAGLPADYWSDTLRFEHYRSFAFAEQSD